MTFRETYCYDFLMLLLGLILNIILRKVWVWFLWMVKRINDQLENLQGVDDKDLESQLDRNQMISTQFVVTRMKFFLSKIIYLFQRKSEEYNEMFVPARDLEIVWTDEWMINSDLSRSKDIARLSLVCWLDIRGSVAKLEQRFNRTVTYSSFLIFKMPPESYGLEGTSFEAKIRKNSTKDEEDGRAHLKLRKESSFASKRPIIRNDGWSELSLGDFSIDHGDIAGHIEARLLVNNKIYWKDGLIVHGVQFRSDFNKNNNKNI